MAGRYSYVDGAHLTKLILEVRREFISRVPLGPDDPSRPNTVRLVAIDTFESCPVEDQVGILSDLLTQDPGVAVRISPGDDPFRYSDVAADYLTDFVCHIVCQVLARDPYIADEDRKRSLNAMHNPG
jgi:hypothetical protein